MKTAEDRLAQLDAVMKSINNDKKYQSDDSSGKLIAKLSDKPLNVSTVPSGSLVLDQILGGGLAKGRIIEIYGPEASGKTSIALTALGNVQKSGGTGVFLDVENALDPIYAAKLGVDTKNLAVAQPNSAEQTLDLLQDLTASGVVDIIVLDSVAALVPIAEIEGDSADITVALVARLMSKALRKLIGTANRSGTTVIFINQTRDKIGGFSPFGPVQVTSGGKALKFYASQRIEVKRGGQIKGDNPEDKNDIIGNEVKFKIVKNKIAPPFGTGSSVLTFNTGINVPAEMIEVGEKYGVLFKPNNRTYTETETGEIFGKSKAEALASLKNDKELMKRMSVALAAKISSEIFGGANDEGEDEESEVEVIETKAKKPAAKRKAVKPTDSFEAEDEEKDEDSEDEEV